MSDWIQQAQRLTAATMLNGVLLGTCWAGSPASADPGQDQDDSAIAASTAPVNESQPQEASKATDDGDAANKSNDTDKSKDSDRSKADNESKATDKSEAADDGNASQAGSQSTRRLSIAPEKFPIYPEDRPIWIDSSDIVRPQDDWAELVVHSVPSLSASKSSESLREQLRIAVEAYLDQYFNSPNAGQSLGFTEAEIETHWIDRQRSYHGQLTTSSGQMYEDACVVCLDESFHDLANSRWNDLRISRRMQAAGWISLLTFVILITATFYLKSAVARLPQETKQPE